MSEEGEVKPDLLAEIVLDVVQRLMPGKLWAQEEGHR